MQEVKERNESFCSKGGSDDPRIIAIAQRREKWEGTLDKPRISPT